MQLKDDGYCFVCGKNNLEGLRLDWKIEGNKTWTDYTPEKRFQGFQDVVHGGILASLLDEAMGRVAWIVYGPSVSAELTIRYLNPASVGQPLRITGQVSREKGRLITGAAEITKPDGTVVAKAEGKLMLWKP